MSKSGAVCDPPNEMFMSLNGACIQWGLYSTNEAYSRVLDTTISRQEILNSNCPQIVFFLILHAIGIICKATKK